MSGFVRFQSTIWTVVRSAREEHAGALNQLIDLYREPVRRFLRARGVPREQAEDLVQEVFLRIFEKDLLKKVEKSKGKFRSFLLGVANNILREAVSRRQALKRGGGAIHVSIEDSDLDVAARDEKDFTKEWMLHLVRLAMKGLAKSGSDSVKRDLAIFRVYIRTRPTYPAIAKEFKVTTTTIKNALYETKRRISKEVAGFVNTYTYSEADFREEMAAFDATAVKAWASKGKKA